MCLILSSLKGEALDKQHLENGYESNPHSAGIMSLKDGVINIDKGSFNFAKFYEAYQKHIGLPHVVHFRFKTSGKIDVDNCHPFVVSTDDNKNPILGMAHNGVLTGFSYKINDKSDTYAFIEQILKPFTKDCR